MTDRYYTAEEAATYLHLHPKTVRRKALEGEIRHERIGRNGRFLRFKLAWLDAYTQQWRQA